jgi:hypothetical protein
MALRIRTTIVWLRSFAIRSFGRRTPVILTVVTLAKLLVDLNFPVVATTLQVPSVESLINAAFGINKAVSRSLNQPPLMRSYSA